ncbi:hypothetical protein [Actinoplanes sp. N902-109]|uniref:hypothetical protein n=1 Tax=Actinoplanes sp. (strain N902-109) TaxID=649831 RepID=UPI0012F94920|nr:hypothetical protein [Actinoplanes sp. N902-109]
MKATVTDEPAVCVHLKLLSEAVAQFPEQFSHVPDQLTDELESWIVVEVTAADAGVTAPPTPTVTRPATASQRRVLMYCLSFATNIPDQPKTGLIHGSQPGRGTPTAGLRKC